MTRVPLPYVYEMHARPRISGYALWSFSGQLFASCCHLPPQPPQTPLAMLAQNWCAPSKNDLKWPKIKQVTNSKLYNIKINRSIA